MLYTLTREQSFRTNRQRLWNFIASPANLQRITPAYMRFEILGTPAEFIYPGQIIRYYVRPLFGLKMNWVTEITHVDREKYFVDEQRFGPYAMWHHQHRLDDLPNGVKMTDVVHYKIPFGVIGDAVNAVLVRKKLHDIFEFRRRQMEALFGVYA